MITIFYTPIDSPILIALTIVFTITSSITIFDTRLIQAKREGNLPPDDPMLPTWVGLISWLHWGLGLTILILNWKYALAIFVIKFILEVLPVLETIGNILMAPFRPHMKLSREKGVTNRVIAILQENDKVSPTLFLKKLNLGYVMAAAIMEELQQLGIVGQNLYKDYGKVYQKDLTSTKDKIVSLEKRILETFKILDKISIQRYRTRV